MQKNIVYITWKKYYNMINVRRILIFHNDSSKRFMLILIMAHISYLKSSQAYWAIVKVIYLYLHNIYDLILTPSLGSGFCSGGYNIAICGKLNPNSVRTISSVNSASFLSLVR